jgi:D-beta-D-heptose 7-phosphate kinase/D-beta-D-heptose 1-phosphate adenosyltransferase
MTLLKPNEQEAQAVAQELRIAAGSPGELARALAERLSAQGVLITLGNQGMVLCQSGRVLAMPAVGGEAIVDLTGAGDSVAAALATALAAGCEPPLAAMLANHAGGIVVMKEGAATAGPDELRDSIARHAGPPARSSPGA